MPSAASRSDRVVLGIRRVFLAVDVGRRRENDAPGSGLGHRLEDVARAVDIDLVADPVIGAGTLCPRAMRDDVGAGDGAFDGTGVPDVCHNEIGCARPAFGSMTGDTHNVVALAEQSGGETAAEYAAGPGDRDSH